MSSLLSGYEYDIFISYRQKDNKGDRWVSEFVEALKAELESTFKEEISVYFDINPHDGLLETHDVDASLREKLKCLVFIPIVSRTFCDPRSFAWEHEFKAFAEEAAKDKFGLKIKLPNGNVANRILPVQIHDLHTDDKALLERELGGILRSIEFIYKEPGVNRPLNLSDDEKSNLNKTRYRNQINKVANAIDEIINSLKSAPGGLQPEKTLRKESRQERKTDAEWLAKVKPARFTRPGVLIGLFMLALVTAIIFIYPKIFRRNSLDTLRSSDGRISVAVLPFQNMTKDTSRNVWQNWIQDILISSLSNSDEIKVRQIESINNLIQSKGLINYPQITPSFASAISQKLEANVFVYGNIIATRPKFRINAKIIDSKTEEVYKSFKIEGPFDEENILPVIDSLAGEIKNFLILSKLKKEVYIDFQRNTTSNSPEAYNYFNIGQKAMGNRDFPSAISFLSQAVAIDSTFYYAILYIAWAYVNQGFFDEGKKWCLKAYEKRNNMPIYQKTYTDFVYAELFETPYDAIKYVKNLLEIDDQVPLIWYDLGWNYYSLQQYDNAIQALEKALELYNKFGIKPWWIHNYVLLGKAYHETNQYKKEDKIYKRAELDFPDDPLLIRRQAILSLSEGEAVAVNRYLKRYISVFKESSVSEADISSNLAELFCEAGILDIAERYYREALLLEPENPLRMNNLAYFLVDRIVNINEGLALVDKALVIKPDNYSYLYTKGWAFYRQGKNREALDILQISWDLRRENALYNHEAFLHLEEVRKKVANQN